MHKLVLLRHGESEWNKKGLFTGWTDVDLTARGEQEAREAGVALTQAGIDVDVAHTSLLKRAIRSLWLALAEMDRCWVPVKRHWRLNERHYGALQGDNKKEKAKEVGQEQVFTWRRSYDVPPPALGEDDKRHPRHDERYADVSDDDLPATECLKDVVQRFVPYYEQSIVPDIKAGKTVLIAAHGNSLRALVKYLDDVSDDEIPHLNIPTGIPLVYELDEDLQAAKHYYLADEDELKELQQEVADQAKTK